jgi:hypothetical protein
MLLLLGATWLSGCGSTASVKSEWQGDAPRGQSFKRVLVVGVSPDVNQRCPFENFLASRMQSETTTAIASCDVVKQKTPLTREGIDQAVAAYQVDAVVATILVAREWDAKKGGERDTRGGAYYKATDAGYATGYYGVYGVPVIYGEFQTAAPITTLQGDVEVQTKLYETRGATLVYTLDSTVRKIESRGAGLADLTTEIADRLRRDGLIR